MEDKQISGTTKTLLTEMYQTLNPAELKRNITRHQDLLYRAYLKKQGQAKTLFQKVDYHKKLTPRLATFLIAEPTAFRQYELVA